ncbi:mechanosensitive channel of small conductance-like 10 [Hibiscus trionum]|uniref:Mechanosensitive channel of small conductance-like 10 n=1 Tax=Hibiscus trionum TaxID=183268 RepID=A0A9W7J553_HIBTR|nr:mechanosensitive channel of small conductance-like 10 [Hibiscus trionum]
MAEKRSSEGEVVINVHSEEDPKGLKGSAPNEIEALDPLQNAQVSPTMSSPTADEPSTVQIQKYKRRNKKKLKRVVLEWVIFLMFLGCLIASLTVDKLHNTRVWDLKAWKWCLLVLVTFSGMLIARWLVSLVVFLIEINFLLRKKVIFHKNKFFDRVQESIFHQYILQTLSGPPLLEMDGKTMVRLNVGNATKGKGSKTKRIGKRKVHRLRRDSVSSWHMKVLVDAITDSGLSINSNALDDGSFDQGVELADKEITNEEEAKYAAHHIFCNVARHDGWHKSYIDEDDLLRFMIKEEVDLVFPLFEGSNTGRIDRKSFTNWMVKVYMDRKALAFSLFDTRRVVEQLNKLVSVILIVVTFIIWLLLVGTATTRVLLVIAAFLFGESFKTIFQVVIFIFVMHPFDVGDRCVVDGVQLEVEEINIFTTTFLKLNNEKVYYPNSVLFSKPISNYYRSPDMGDAIEFCIDLKTPAEIIGRLKDKIRTHLEANSPIWHPRHLVVVTEIGNDNKLKMALHCSHTMNFQDFRERNKRRTDLIIELKRILEALGISYNILPEQGSLNQVAQDTPDAATYAAPDL